jgi:hypothetical protein
MYLKYVTWVLVVTRFYISLVLGKFRLQNTSSRTYFKGWVYVFLELRTVQVRSYEKSRCVCFPRCVRCILFVCYAVVII